jgi:hypothetical protein
MPFLTKDRLIQLYSSGLSMMDIAKIHKVSPHKVTYWMEKYAIDRRSRSDATYVKKHPHGDPFKLQLPSTPEDILLFGMGLGLYWGEGTKANKTSVRLGNTDPQLIKTFIIFLIEIFDVKKDDLRFGLQIFTDISSSEAMKYWINALQIKKKQFYKTIITKSGSLGTYRKKSQYGVLTVYYLNKKLKDLLTDLLSEQFSYNPL